MDDGIQAKIVEIDQRSKSNTHRINDLEEDNRALHQLATSVEVLATKQETIEANISEIKDDVKSLKAIPGGKWEALVKATVTAIVGASKKLLIGSAAASIVCIILNVLGVLSVEVTLAVIGFATAIGMFYLWKAKNENRSKYAIKYIQSLPETYTAEEKARFLEIVLKD